MKKDKPFGQEFSCEQDDDFLWEEFKKTITPLPYNIRKKQERYLKIKKTDQKENMIDSNTNDSGYFVTREESSLVKRDHLFKEKNIRDNKSGSNTSFYSKKPDHVQNLNHLKQVQKGQVKIDFILDFHGLTQEQAYQSLYITLTQRVKQNNARCLLVITGKGLSQKTGINQGAFFQDSEQEKKGILNKQLPKWLNNPALSIYLYGYAIAHRRHGGNGAYYLFLRKYKKIVEDAYKNKN